MPVDAAGDGVEAVAVSVPRRSRWLLTEQTPRLRLRVSTAKKEPTRTDRPKSRLLRRGEVESFTREERRAKELTDSVGWR